MAAENADRASVSSWGRLRVDRPWMETPAFVDRVPAAFERLRARNVHVLAHGCGRSYGDSCLNADGGLIVTTRMDRCHFFDVGTGVLRADAGLTIDELHRITVPKGWLIPVTPGTRFVTLGGAVANDVHGKNHHAVGSFGHHVRRLGLRRSDGSVLECAPDRETEMLRATIGGLGLTGLIEWVEIGLLRIASSDIEAENLRFANVDMFFELSAESAAWPYTVAWVDCLGQGKNLGRGIFSRGRHASAGPLLPDRGGRRSSVPVTPPISLINRMSVRAFNELYYRRSGARFAGRQHFDDFFYPLDRVRNWNRVYGPRGFYQYQCAVPPDRARAATGQLLERIAANGSGSCLVVLKNFGDAPPAGMLSFPGVGTTLALDFPNQGKKTLDLLSGLDEIVAAAGGRIYPAKDARMSPAMFRAGYPALDAFRPFVDAAFQSDFWRRVA